MSTQYRLVQSGKTASGGCSAGQGSSEPVAPRIYLFLFLTGVKYVATDMFPLRGFIAVCCKQELFSIFTLPSESPQRYT
jgi:hypothetical protein